MYRTPTEVIDSIQTEFIYDRKLLILINTQGSTLLTIDLVFGELSIEFIILKCYRSSI